MALAVAWPTGELVERVVLARSADWGPTRMLQPRVPSVVVADVDRLVSEVFVRLGPGVGRSHVLRAALEASVPPLRRSRSTERIRVTVRLPDPLIESARARSRTLPAVTQGGGRVSALATVGVMRTEPVPSGDVRRVAAMAEWSTTSDWQLWLPRHRVEAMELRRDADGLLVSDQVAAGLLLVTSARRPAAATPPPVAAAPAEPDPLDFDVMDDDAFDAALAEFDEAIARSAELLGQLDRPGL
ncbi:hypothetical protein DVS28_b0603 (plasmid) [Euzebya pacifica]|uniref:Uncharacterized protein n=1 Tax=Euzebya pacifica TaxID=1608957 RepID=A0A346Y796_9ACTN|nr:hypothetical protein DVS28_b0603 [Euzebya pacifica]